MKLIKAYIRPERLEDVYKALHHESCCSMTVFEGEGTGSFCDPEARHGSLNFPAMHSKVVKIEIAACDERVDTITKLVREQARTGSRGDGLIFVVPIEHTLRIRDGRTGSEVLREAGVDNTS